VSKELHPAFLTRRRKFDSCPLHQLPAVRFLDKGVRRGERIVGEVYPVRNRVQGQRFAEANQDRPQVSEGLEKALALSTQDRGLLIDRLIQSLDEGPAEKGVEQAWSDEIKRRVDDIRSGKVEMIPGDEVRRRLAARLRNGAK
jgi:putative addiction module component (TIGR02574 family)